MANGMISETHAPHNSKALSQEEIKLREDLQSKLAQIFLNQAPGPTHISRKQTQKNIEILWWHQHMTALVENLVHKYDTCNSHNT